MSSLRPLARCTHVCGRPNVRPVLGDRAAWRARLHAAQDALVLRLQGIAALVFGAELRERYVRVHLFVASPPELLRDALERFGSCCGRSEARRLQRVAGESVDEQPEFVCPTLFEVDEELAPIDPCDGRTALVHFLVATLSGAVEPPDDALDDLHRALVDAGDACVLGWFEDVFVVRDGAVVARRDADA